jgi:transposase
MLTITRARTKKITKTMLKLELKGEPNSNSLKFLDNLFNEYKQLVRIADTFIYHLYPYYANITEREKLEGLNKLIRSMERKAIINRRKEKEKKKETDDDFAYQRLPYLFAWLEGKISKESRYTYSHSYLLKTLLHRFIKYAKQYYGIDVKYANLEKQSGLVDIMHNNAENAYKHRTIPNMRRRLINVMPIRVSKRPLPENRRNKDKCNDDKPYERDTAFIFENGKIMFRIGRGKHKAVFKIATRFNDIERLGMLIHAIQGDSIFTIGDPCYLVRKETDNRYRYYIMVSISKNVDVKALYESIKNKSKNKIRIIGIDSNISKYVATMFCIEVDKENKTYKLINAKGIDSKAYINAVKKYEEEKRKLQQGRMKGKKQKKKGSRYKEEEDYIIRNKCGDSKRIDLRRQLIGYICNQILEFANENDADIIVIEDLKGLNKELKTLRIIKKELGKLYKDVNSKGNNAIDDKINEINKSKKYKTRRPLLEILNKIKEYSNAKDKVKVAKYIIKQRQIIEKRMSLLSMMAYYQFKQELEVEALWNGKLLYTINPKYTSQQCLRCNHTNKLNRITQRQFKCIKCNFGMNADFNASANIALMFATKILKLKLELNPKQGKDSSTVTSTAIPLHASINAGSKLGVVADTLSSVASTALQGEGEGRLPCLRGQTDKPCSAKRSIATLDEFLEKKGNGG